MNFWSQERNNNTRVGRPQRVVITYTIQNKRRRAAIALLLILFCMVQVIPTRTKEIVFIYILYCRCFISAILFPLWDQKFLLAPVIVTLCVLYFFIFWRVFFIDGLVCICRIHRHMRRLSNKKDKEEETSQKQWEVYVYSHSHGNTKIHGLYINVSFE